MNEVNEKLRKSCEEAIGAFQKLKNEEYTEISSKLEWCIGSYNYDNNPAGLNEFGQQSLKVLKAVKQEQPRKVNKKVIDSLEKAIKGFNKN